MTGPNKKGQGRTALVTGGSAGIGKALAQVFAENGFDLVLTARRKDKLNEVADTLRQRHGVQVTIIESDLTQSDAPQQLFDATEGAGKPIDVLINNAGFGVPGKFLSNDWRTHGDFIQVLMIAVAHNCHLFLPNMIGRKYGRILNIASLAGLVPASPGSTLYGGAKAFVIQLSQTLHMEAVDHGVHVCALCPGFTYSEFHDVTGTRDMVSRMPRYRWMEADIVARQGYHAVMQGKPVHVNGGVNKLTAGLMMLLPHKAALRASLSAARSFRPSVSD